MVCTLEELQIIKNELGNKWECNDSNCDVCKTHNKAIWLIEREIKLRQLNPVKEANPEAHSKEDNLS